MSGMEPMLIGAALGGGISAARGGNPITGALLGGIGGSVAGAAMPSLQGGIGNFINGIGTNAMAGGNVMKGLQINANLLGGSQLAGASALNAPTTFSGLGLTPASTGMTAGQAALNAAPTAAMTSSTNPFMAAAGWAKENPMMALQGAQFAKNTLIPEQQPMPQVQPVGLMRGTQMQQQPQQFAMARPQISLI